VASQVPEENSQYSTLALVGTLLTHETVNEAVVMSETIG
jgi:hypothetical protein